LLRLNTFGIYFSSHEQCAFAKIKFYLTELGAVHKRRPQSRGVCPVRTFFGQGGFFRCERPNFSKNIGFFEIYGVSARTMGRGLSQCGHFAD